MSLRIVTDSSADIPPEQAAALGISVLPLFINVGSRSYRDGLDLSRADFYRLLPEFNPAPRTAAPGPEVIREMYERLANEGATEILSIHVARRLSSVIDTARLAAKEVRRAAVTVMDSGQLSLGIGFAALTAARAASLGHSLAEVVDLIKDQLERTYAFAALDTFTYLVRSGRVNAVLAALGSPLQIKPLMKLHASNLTAERVRTQAGAVRRLIRLLSEHGQLENVAIVHANAYDRAEVLLQQVCDFLPPGEVPIVEIAPVIGTHLGPGTLGFVCVRKSTPAGETG
jgi:DegV family protein with EDD domain